MVTTKEKYLELLEIECLEHKLDYKLLAALIQVESNWDKFAARYEHNFMYTTDICKYAVMNKITESTERMLQKTSFSLAQIMGGTARDMGYKGPLPQLFEPETNLLWMCKFFKKRCSPYIKVSDQISVYNAGTVKKNLDGSYFNQKYVDKVLAALSEFL